MTCTFREIWGQEFLLSYTSGIIILHLWLDRSRTRTSKTTWESRQHGVAYPYMGIPRHFHVVYDVDPRPRHRLYIVPDVSLREISVTNFWYAYASSRELTRVSAMFLVSATRVIWRKRWCVKRFYTNSSMNFTTNNSFPPPTRYLIYKIAATLLIISHFDILRMNASWRERPPCFW